MQNVLDCIIVMAQTIAINFFSLQIFPTENGLYLVGLNLTIATAA